MVLLCMRSLLLGDCQRQPKHSGDASRYKAKVLDCSSNVLSNNKRFQAGGGPSISSSINHRTASPYRDSSIGSGRPGAAVSGFTGAGTATADSATLGLAYVRQGHTDKEEREAQQNGNCKGSKAQQMANTASEVRTTIESQNRLLGRRRG
eukprot:CAMPEP_0115539552 /NCGR_PEP_ID=MMETSP0271-20121206/89466_1 /TAXON_ID=71861 /ORGANISM="Scrippsiella trochoidea, Strain CCMP3099" /LENGTH=149 /DNA_ID=CAMNT_0002972509 /DNA_START=50 /DNA_END=497 /DNA_ORIENTATION=-